MRTRLDEILDWVAFFLLDTKIGKPIQQWCVNRVVSWIVVDR